RRTKHGGPGHLKLPSLQYFTAHGRIGCIVRSYGSKSLALAPFLRSHRAVPRWLSSVARQKSDCLSFGSAHSCKSSNISELASVTAVKKPALRQASRS